MVTNPRIQPLFILPAAFAMALAVACDDSTPEPPPLAGTTSNATETETETVASSSGDSGPTPLELHDEQCQLLSEEKCTFDALSSGRCQWTTMTTYTDGCPAVSEVEVCRGVSSFGEGCGSIEGLPGCSNFFEENGFSEQPFYRVTDVVEIAHPQGCKPPPGFLPCEGPPPDWPAECSCPCE